MAQLVKGVVTEVIFSEIVFVPDIVCMRFGMFRRSGQNILIVIGLEFSYVFHKKCRQWYYSYGIVGFRLGNNNLFFFAELLSRLAILSTVLRM